MRSPLRSCSRPRRLRGAHLIDTRALHVAEGGERAAGGRAVDCVSWQRLFGFCGCVAPHCAHARARVGSFTGDRGGGGDVDGSGGAVRQPKMAFVQLEDDDKPSFACSRRVGLNTSARKPSRRCSSPPLLAAETLQDIGAPHARTRLRSGKSLRIVAFRHARAIYAGACAPVRRFLVVAERHRTLASKSSRMCARALSKT